MVWPSPLPKCAIAARFSTSKPTAASRSRPRPFLGWSPSSVHQNHAQALLAVATVAASAATVTASSATAPVKVALVATAAMAAALVVATVVSVDALKAVAVVLATVPVISVAQPKKASATNARAVSTTALLEIGRAHV